MIANMLSIAFYSGVILEVVNKKIEKEIKAAFGGQIRNLRLARGFSMRGFANEADLDYSLLAKIENGVISPTITTSYKIAETLGMSLSDLFNFDYPSQLRK
jgi:transcriptional regulator with XRE-family HTH domain